MKKTCLRMTRLADDPLGPYEKCPLNPVLNSGHETTYFPFKEGVAALAITDGNEHFTMQYAPDGMNFQIACVVKFTPTAAGPFTPDAFTRISTSPLPGAGVGISPCSNTSCGAPVRSYQTALIRPDSA